MSCNIWQPTLSGADGGQCWWRQLRIGQRINGNGAASWCRRNGGLVIELSNWPGGRHWRVTIHYTVCISGIQIIGSNLSRVRMSIASFFWSLFLALTCTICRPMLHQSRAYWSNWSVWSDDCWQKDTFLLLIVLLPTRNCCCLRRQLMPDYWLLNLRPANLDCPRCPSSMDCPQSWASVTLVWWDVDYCLLAFDLRN